jgi:hypothetical protein
VITQSYDVLAPWLKIVFICTPHLGSPLVAGLLGRFGRDLIFAPVELMKSVDNLAATSIATALRKKGRIFRNTFGFRTAAQLKKAEPVLPAGEGSIPSIASILQIKILRCGRFDGRRVKEVGWKARKGPIGVAGDGDIRVKLLIAGSQCLQHTIACNLSFVIWADRSIYLWPSLV